MAAEIVQPPRNPAAAVYDAAADFFDTAAVTCWDRFGQRTVDRLSLCAGAHVLDVCCGSGGSALPAARAVGRNGRVIGIDLAEKLLACARAKAKSEGLANVEFRAVDLDTLEGVTGDFDAVVCVFGIFFVSDMAGALARLWKRVRPGGALAVTSWGPRLFEPASTAFWDAVQRVAPAHHKTFSPWDRIAEPTDLRGLFEASGIGDVKVEPEAATHALASPEDWWTIVLGSGYRGTLEQLDRDAREQVRTLTLDRLRADKVGSIEANVLYATARRSLA